MMQDDQAFFGAAVSLTPFRWVFWGFAFDLKEQHHRDERQRLHGTFRRLEALLWERNAARDQERGWVDCADVRQVLDQGPLTAAE